MIIPVAVKERPGVPTLGMEWPSDLYLGDGTSSKLSYKDSSVLITDAEFGVNDYGTRLPLRFSIQTPVWELTFEGQPGSKRLHYRAVGEEAVGWRDVKAPFSQIAAPSVGGNARGRFDEGGSRPEDQMQVLRGEVGTQ